MASSSSQSIPAISSWNYHVFLSFRGEDTRKTFVDHLYTALVQQGIYTYKDDETLPRGESIGPFLLKAIEESQIAVIIFSKNYVGSSWCLDELAHIMKCRDTKRQLVMPIFYDVEPSEVRKQKRKYGETFSKHESVNYDKVEFWRKALDDACNLSGWELKHIANGHESKGIREIVDTISHRLHPIISSANENLIGVEARVHDLKSKLQIGSGSVLMIGIWGIGGGGKTTLAYSVYDEISSSFDGCCFLENVQGESNKNGLEKLQEKVLRSALKQKKVHVNTVEEGRRMIKDRLFHRKVLIVLDDVARLDHLEYLAGSRDWFGEGSRIIITTRDKHFLNPHKVSVIHDVSLLNDGEAIKLFRKLAPRDYRPIEDYELLSKCVVSYSGGLPLAVKVLGCFLCDKDINEWRSTLARLKEIPDKDIVEKLKISYDGLKEVERELFLDIACFFKGVNKNYAMEILDACGLHAVIGVKVLIQKALITITNDGLFGMHDLVQEMGHYIVRGEYPKNPEKYTRVWKNEDVLKICAMDATTELDKIEAISYLQPCNDDVVIEVLPCHVEVVANMKNLRWIDWTGNCQSPILLSSFPPRKLCCLTLKLCQKRHLWEGKKYLPNLRIIKLYHLTNLIETPNFDGLPNLERFVLDRCDSLKEIHPSIGRLKRLVYLNVEYCPNLKMFPCNTHSHKLETFILKKCPKLFKFSEIQEKIENLGSLFFHGAIRKLILKGCNLGDGDMDSVIWELSNLKELDIGSNNFSRLNFSVLQLPRLKWLDVSECKSLVELSGLPSSIAILRAKLCSSLESVGDISNCKWLWKVSFYGNHNLRWLGDNTILDSMLQGNAIENHFISFTSSGYHIPKRVVDRMVKGETFRLQLPHNWYNQFSGFLICNANNYFGTRVTITLNEEQNKDSQFEVLQECDDAYHPFFDTYVGYVSFMSLMRHTQWLNPAYNTISFSLDATNKISTYESRFVAELVPRRSEDDVVQRTKVVTNCSQFYDEETPGFGEDSFTIQHHSKTSIKILWNIYN